MPRRLPAAVPGAAEPGLSAREYAQRPAGSTRVREPTRGREAHQISQFENSTPRSGWHSVPLAEGRPRDEVRILKLAAHDARAFAAALTAVEAAAARAGIRRVAVRCQTRYADAFRHLIERGFRVRWSDLRMTQDGYPERHPEQGVLFSNWEI